ncbi:unnamed protein product [Chrysodeixis includens]|uniref:Uncharacterized protein n=1 Tax=Chrysodeixis includens TaxID=689277 RepID=A0A9P0C1D6_CHRIL|nr:unnamed protein product [Chrysodeixis includens]
MAGECRWASRRVPPQSVAGAPASMAAQLVALACLLSALAPHARAAVPGTFFWKPRVGLELAVPTHFPRSAKQPTWANINAGFVVLIEGYQAGMTVAALASLLDVLEPFPHLNPGSAYYYTNMYRWMLRYISLLPDWLGGKSGNYVETHKVWRKRFYYMDNFVPQWLRQILFFVKPEEWKKEEVEWTRFAKYAEPSFGKYYKYPSKVFNNFNSMRIAETVENLDITNASV